MSRILVHEECEVFDAVCKCGERVVSLSLPGTGGTDILMDIKGWVYVMDDDIFIPKLIDLDVSARSRCMECGLLSTYQMRFRAGVLSSWSEITKYRGLSSEQDIGTKQPEEVQ